MITNTIYANKMTVLHLIKDAWRWILDNKLNPKGHLAGYHETLLPMWKSLQRKSNMIFAFVSHPYCSITLIRCKVQHAMWHS